MHNELSETDRDILHHAHGQLAYAPVESYVINPKDQEWELATDVTAAMAMGDLIMAINRMADVHSHVNLMADSLIAGLMEVLSVGLMHQPKVFFEGLEKGEPGREKLFQRLYEHLADEAPRLGGKDLTPDASGRGMNLFILERHEHDITLSPDAFAAFWFVGLIDAHLSLHEHTGHALGMDLEQYVEHMLRLSGHLDRIIKESHGDPQTAFVEALSVLTVH